jgi:amino acid adenylation domain-containing protein
VNGASPPNVYSEKEKSCFRNWSLVEESRHREMATTLNNTRALNNPERHPLLFDWNNNWTDYPRHQTISQIFEQQVEQRPDAIALKFRDQQMTYRQLNERANQVAHRLRELGVGPEVMVGTLLERSLEMVVGLLAILKAGGAFVPLDANYPAERLAFMAADTKAPVMLVQQPVAQRLSDQNWSRAIVLSLDGDPAEIDRHSTQNLTHVATAENLAYVMYTSGSTGQPKGVMVGHRAVVRLVKNTNYVNLTDQEVFLQFSPISFDASTLEIWGPLLNGGCLAIMPPDVQSLAELGAAIRKHGVTSMWLTAGLFNVMVEQRLEDLGSLRQLLVGGDALSPAHVRKAIDGLPECILINGYGPTEGTTFTCCHTISREDAQGSSIPIGRPIANTQVYLLDSDNESVPGGEAGELCIGGDGLARGYLNQPELTAEKFLPHPFSNEPFIGTSDARIYKTGDLARYRPDGAIEFLGRVDNQVKISGYRIELGEIEAVLLQHPDVQSAAVLARQDTVGEKKLVGYVIPRGHNCQTADLRTFLARKLPFYMVPAAFVLLDVLPLSPNGKLDRAALPAPEAVDTGNSAAPVFPQTEMELKIADIWRRVLGLKQVSITDNFFDLGGDSLLLLEAHAELQKVIIPDLAITVLFEYSTIRSLAQHLTVGEKSSPILEAQERARQQQKVWVQQRYSRTNQTS